LVCERLEGEHAIESLLAVAEDLADGSPDDGVFDPFKRLHDQVDQPGFALKSAK
jgi:hypothetical protein